MRSFSLAILSTLALPVAGQNPLQHYPGTSFTTRGTAGAQGVTLLQRIPHDQACGRTAIHSLTYVVQNDGTTPGLASWSIEVRRHDSAGPALGSPDMSAAGLILSLPIATTFPAGPFAYFFTTSLSSPITLPTAAPGVSSDLYLGVVLPPRTAAINMSVHAGADSSARATAIGYTGVVGVVGLAWEAIAGVNPALYSPAAVPNPALNITTRFVDEVLQPYLDATPVPAFGYGGLFPSGTRGDRVGLRSVAQGTPLDVSVLLVSTSLVPPIGLPGIGNLCLATNAIPVAASLFGQLSPPNTVAATFGPYPAVTGLGSLYFQTLNYKFGGGNRLSTACRIDM